MDFQVRSSCELVNSFQNKKDNKCYLIKLKAWIYHCTSFPQFEVAHLYTQNQGHKMLITKLLCLYDGKLSLCNNLSILCFSLLLLTLHSLIHSFSYSFTCIRLCLIQDKPPINSMCQTSVLLSLSFISELLVHICYIKTKVVKVCINLIERIHYSKLMISLYCIKVWE